METLEQIARESITGETCINKYRSMTEAYVPESDINHYNCNGLNKNCPGYLPIRIFEIPLNQARFL